MVEVAKDPTTCKIPKAHRKQEAIVTKVVSSPSPPLFGIMQSDDVAPIAPIYDLPFTNPHYTSMVYVNLNDGLHNDGASVQTL